MAVMNVKMNYEDKVDRIEGGVRAIEDLSIGKLIIYDVQGNVIAKRELNRVAEWWPEQSGPESRRTRVDEVVRKVEEGLAPDVVRIRYSIGTDWSDEPAIYFRIILSDDAASQRLPAVAKEVRERLELGLDFTSLGLRPYHNFRSESEQAALKDGAWE